MRTTGIHHVAIICSDYDRSKAFYVETLGFSIIQETFRAARTMDKVHASVCS